MPKADELLKCFDDMCVFLATHGFTERDERAVAIRELIQSQPEITEKDLKAWADEAECRVEDERHWSPLFDVMKEMLEELGVKVTK